MIYNIKYVIVYNYDATPITQIHSAMPSASKLLIEYMAATSTYLDLIIFLTSNSKKIVTNIKYAHGKQTRPTTPKLFIGGVHCP